jgi:hypothetical protein
MSEEIQKQLDAHHARIQELEDRPQTPGPQGKPGNIEAAIANAERVATKIVTESDTRHQARVGELVQTVRDQEARFEKVVRDLTKQFNENLDHVRANIRGEVAAAVLEILKGYHLLDENSCPTPYADTSGPNALQKMIGKGAL